MSNKIQSIEDLMTSSDKDDLGNSVKSKFSKKSKEIKLKEIERSTKRIADQKGVPHIDLSSFSISPEALSLVDEDESKRLSTVCFYFDGKNVRLGTTDYDNPEVKELLKQLEEKYYSKGVLYLISEHSFKRALKIYDAIPKPRKIIRGVKITEEELSKYSEKFSGFKDVQGYISKTSLISEMITVILAAAIKTNVSDVHIEGEESDVKIRFRIDGFLHDVASIDIRFWDKIIGRLKVLTKVKINISDKPQDGRMSIFLKEERIDIRSSFLPTNYGESVVLRLLRPSQIGLSFEELGLAKRDYERLKKEVVRPNGMVITTGPTGSGKTTTIYSILKKLNNPEAKIITIEDPIEYQLSGISQSQTTERYTFSHGLRSIVRQDPDIIMVGEIRDLETAEISIQAALTGHLVLSTIHTNNAAGTVPRLLSMGAKPFLLSPALNVMIGQRLVRKLCPDCKYEDDPGEERMKKIIEIIEVFSEEDKAKIDMNNLKFYKSKGCDICQDIGYKGRIGLFEIMPVDKDIEKMILSGKVSEYDMNDISIKKGMVTILQDGILKALNGITSIEEVFRIAGQKVKK